ncbi:MAG: homoserine kinase, partial [Candidatus Marinimicrobia bacterium]|nr:homoserine kinase [Candidatus Neomarinimicrobiota bacterium]
TSIPLQTAIRQWANTAGFAAGLCLSDYQLLSRSMVDLVAEPVRAQYIPKFYELKDTAQKAGALGSSISGSGSTVFALCRGKDTAKRVCDAMSSLYQNASISFKSWISPINSEGPRIVNLESKNQ